MQEQNIALLAKQSWELMTGLSKPHLQLLKSRYLGNESFLSHSPKRNGSFFWQGLCKTKELLSKGVIFRVETGGNIDIWKDPCVPLVQDHLPKPSSEAIPTRGSLPFTVEQLLNPDLSWNLQLLQHLFDSETIRSILTIKLQPTVNQDKLIWQPNPNGQFTVKTAYELARVPSVSLHPTADHPWKGLWRLKIHERHKLLLWKMVWDILPTSTRTDRILHHGQISCSFCFTAVETLDHIMLHCPFTSIIWSRLKWPLNFEATPDMSVKEWIMKLSLQAEMSKLAIGLTSSEQHTLLLHIVIGFDYIWQLRNNNRQRLERLDPLEAVKIISGRLESYEKAWTVKNMELAHGLDAAGQPLCHAHFSTDCSFKDGQAWLGIALSNQFGSLVSAWSFASAAQAPELGELEGIDKAVSLAQGLKITRLRLASDAKDHVDLLQSKSLGPPPQLADLFGTVLSKLAAFPDWSIVFRPRSFNFLAHNIANWGSTCKYNGPICISDLPSSVLFRASEMLLGPSSPFVASSSSVSTSY